MSCSTSKLTVRSAVSRASVGWATSVSCTRAKPRIRNGQKSGIGQRVKTKRERERAAVVVGEAQRAAVLVDEGHVGHGVAWLRLPGRRGLYLPGERDRAP